MSNKLKIGEKAFFSKTIAESDIYAFARIVGDFNALHINEEEAKRRGFPHRIAHGMLAGSLISTVLGNILPGPGTIYLEQNLKFKKPVYIGDTCTAKVVVDHVITEEKGIYRLNTWVENQKGEIVTEGFAVVKYQREGENKR